MNRDTSMTSRRPGAGTLTWKLSTGGQPAQPAATVKCAHCSDDMDPGTLPTFHRGFGIAVLVVGLLLAVFVSLLIGLPMVVIGAYMGAASKSVWACPSCGALTERMRT